MKTHLNQPAISVVVPVYDEENSIIPFLKRIEPVLEKISSHYEILFILDPCNDNTEKVVQNETNRNNKIKLIILSRRFGQPTATMAGIYLCRGDVCTTIDVDLQDPPELITDMIQKINDGYDIVYTKRRTRKGETRLKRFISHIGYKTINKLSEVSIPKDVGDYRMISRRVIDELKKMNESHTYLRGMVAYIGFKQTCIDYDRDVRYTGKGKYNRFLGSIKIGLDGLISFGSKPLQLASILGASISLISFLVGLWYFLQKIFGVSLTPGLPTIVLAVTFFSGVQLLCLGIVGEYIGRIYDEVKKRPSYIIDRIIENTSRDK